MKELFMHRVQDKPGYVHMAEPYGGYDYLPWSVIASASTRTYGGSGPEISPKDPTFHQYVQGWGSGEANHALSGRVRVSLGHFSNWRTLNEQHHKPALDLKIANFFFETLPSTVYQGTIGKLFK